MVVTPSKCPDLDISQSISLYLNTVFFELAPLGYISFMEGAKMISQCALTNISTSESNVLG